MGVDVGGNAKHAISALGGNRKRDASRSASDLEHARAANMSHAAVPLSVLDIRGRLGCPGIVRLQHLGGRPVVLRLGSGARLAPGRVRDLPRTGGALLLCKTRALLLTGLVDLGVPGQLHALSAQSGLHGPQHLAVKVLEHQLYKHLGLWPRNKHAALAGNVDGAERRLSQDILERLAATATHRRIMHDLKLLGR